MTKMDNLYTLGEEIANAITHGLGAVLSVAGLVVMVALAAVHADTWTIVSVSVFGSTMILLYMASTLYHSIPHPRAKKVLRILDHCAIFLLIAGSYTPFVLVSIRGPWGWTLFAIVWTIALVGILLKSFYIERWPILTTLLYIAMGWTVMIAIKPVVAALPANGILLLVIGGVTYTLGTLFYAWEKLPYNHAIWHVFVLAGTTAHFFAVLFFVVLGHPY